MSQRDEERGRDVVLAHPGKQHAYEVGVALERAGRLRRFYTSCFFHSGSPLRQASRWLATGGRHRVIELLDKRSHPGISPARVQSWPYAEALSRTVGRSRLAPAAIRDRLQYPFVNAMFDRYLARQVKTMRLPPAAVYGFLGASEAAFAAAKRRGITTVLDVPIVLDALDVITAENKACGVAERTIGLSADRVRREVTMADWIVAPSEAVACSIRRVDGAARNITIVPFGVQVDHSAASPLRISPPDRLRVLFAGRMEPRKGVHVLVEAFRRAPDSWTLSLAGPAGGGEYLAALRASYGPNVSEAGNLTQVELRAFLERGDVFVFPSLAEGSALITYQALAAGLPSIVTAESGSVVRDGIEGFVVPARDPGAILTCLNLLAENDGLRQRMAAAAGARARSFTWPRYHAAIVAAVDCAIAQHAAGFAAGRA